MTRPCCHPLHARRDGVHVALHTCVRFYGQPWRLLVVVK